MKTVNYSKSNVFDIIALLLFIFTLVYLKSIMVNCIVTIYALVRAIDVIKQDKQKGIKKLTLFKYFLFVPILFIIEIFIALQIKSHYPSIYSVRNSTSVAVSLVPSWVRSLFTAPITEEFFFRYIPKKNLNEIGYYIVSIFLFCYLHTMFLNPILMLIRLPSAILFSMVYKRTDNIIVPIALHSFNNLFPMLLMLI